jgi:hypothetical protein
MLVELSRVGRRIFAVIPLGDGGKYVIPSHELDVTHVIRRPYLWWRQVFNDAGWSVHSLLPPSWVKKSWTDKWPDGFGFIVGHQCEESS